MSRSAKLIHILLVEDEAADVRLTMEALWEAKVTNRIQVVKDGVEAIALLRHEGEYRDAATPDVVFLDLNLPRKNGYEVLAEIRADPLLQGIPVVVLTTSQAEADIDAARQLHANRYVKKPMDLDRFLAALRGIEGFWLGIVKLPPGAEHEAG
jgi:two-component system, chemotaxis family, response regulator Rcp1